MRDGGSVFPDATHIEPHGLSRRDYFAAAAINSIEVAGDFDELLSGDAPAHVAKWGYLVADAMLAARTEAT
jgi:hypothetical protein